jgi:radical SAM superfamily enzyme YgiQ (UPF0313 family)
MNRNREFCVKLFHCGNKNIGSPGDTAQKNIFFMPMGLAALANVLKQTGVDVEIVHSDLEVGRPIEEVLDFDTVDAVGFDCHWVNQALAVLDTARLIKKINPGVFTFLGGFSASLFAEEIVSGYSQVDAVIRGDAEVPIAELCRALRGEVSFHDVQNLVWKDKNNRLVKNVFSYTVDTAEIDKLNYSAYHLMRNFKHYQYASKFWTGYRPIADSTMFFLALGRGCQYICTFCGGNCDAQYRMNHRKKTVVRSMDSIIDTITHASAMGFDTFYVCLEFEGSDEWYIRLFERIRMENLDINFIYGSWGVPSEALLDALSETFKHALIEISPETANLELRKKNKDSRIFYTNEQLEKILDYAESKGNIKIQLYFGYYLDGDTEESIWETVNYTLSLLMKFPHLLEIQYANFSTDPGSLFFLYPERFKMDIQVRNFDDFIHHIRENFVKKQRGTADMILHRPRAISRKKDMEIRGKMRLLNDLFLYYRKSVSYILQKTKKTDTVFSFLSFLKQETRVKTADEPFSPGEIKEMLLEHCGRKDIQNETLTRLLYSEEQTLAETLKSTLNIPRLYLDKDFGNIPEVETLYLNTGTAEETLKNIEFDI